VSQIVGALRRRCFKDTNRHSLDTNYYDNVRPYVTEHGKYTNRQRPLPRLMLVIGIYALTLCACAPHSQRLPSFGGPLSPLADSLLARGVALTCSASPPFKLGNGRVDRNGQVCAARAADTTYAIVQSSTNEVVYRYRAWQVPDSAAKSAAEVLSNAMGKVFGQGRICDSRWVVGGEHWDTPTYHVSLRIRYEDLPGLLATMIVEEQREPPSC
jgi:hypothetical protein